jgi:hypothetical protein
MTGYQSDQFFNISKTRPDQWNGGRPSSFVDGNALNQEFQYPDSTIRYQKADGTYGTRVLQKGYIRRINEFNDGNEGPILCRFQFNPQYINQGAQFQSSILNPIYQPIEQLQQPIASMTNFSFRLMFDRSMELNSSSTIRASATDNPWEAGGPSQVGVLHDISALFRVIGQGISADDVAGAITRAQETLAAGDNRVGKDQLTEEEQESFDSAVTNSAAFFQNNANIGNTAFILPQPVRIVFSSLYIVEGFVTSTALEILKFSSSYVPMQAQVTLAVSAIYLGFAKRNTYFTHVLEQSATDRRNRLETATAAQNADVRVLRNEFNRVSVRLLRRDTSVQDDRNPADRPGTSISDSTIIFSQLFDDVSPPTGKRYTNPRLWAGPTNWSTPPRSSNRNSQGETTSTSRGFDPSAAQDQSVGSLFDNGALTEVSLKFRATLFGPVRATSEALRGVVFNALSSDDIINDDSLKRAEKAESPWKSVTVTTKQQWLTETDPSTSTLFSKLDLPSQFVSSLNETNNWLLLFEAEYKIVLNGTSYTEPAFSALVLPRSTQSTLTSVLPFSWSRYYNTVSDAASVTATTNTTPPGTIVRTDSYTPIDDQSAIL